MLPKEFTQLVEFWRVKYPNAQQIYLMLWEFTLYFFFFNMLNKSLESNDLFIKTIFCIMYRISLTDYAKGWNII